MVPHRTHLTRNALVDRRNAIAQDARTIERFAADVADAPAIHVRRAATFAAAAAAELSLALHHQLTPVVVDAAPAEPARP